MTHRATEAAAPNANHDQAGWRRRGDTLNSIAIAAKSIPRARGQRATFQTSATMSSSNESPSDRPKAMATKARTSKLPAVKASTKANPYFFADGRSCSMP